MDADKVAEAIALEIAKKSKAFVSEKLFEIQRSGQCSFSVRFMDANRAENKADLERAYDVELVKLYFENFKYTVSNVETGGCIFSDCRPHCNFHQNAGKYASMHVSLQQHLKAQVDVVKRQLFPDAFSETAKLATKKQATEVARRPAAAGGDDVVQTAVLPSPDELAVVRRPERHRLLRVRCLGREAACRGRVEVDHHDLAGHRGGVGQRRAGLERVGCSSGW